MALAKMYNWTLVLPDYVVEYNAYQDAHLMPLRQFYDTHHLAAFAQARGFRVVEHLPPDKYAACMLQLQHHRSSAAPDTGLLNAWAVNHDVVCLTAENAFYLNTTVPILLDDLRLALRPSKQFESEVTQIVHQMVEAHNISMLPAVHVRIQADWVLSCPQWGREDQLQCMVGEGHLVNILRDTFSLPEGSKILVISDTAVEDLPVLCSVFQCTSKAKLWLGKSSTFFDSPTTLAFVDFVLACNMQLFFGNYYSKFSQEVVEVLNAHGHQGHFYNPVCPQEQDCP